MPEFTSRYSLLISLLLLSAAAFSSYFFYRKSSLNKTKKYFLIFLKTAGIFLILFLLIEPSILAVVNSTPHQMSVILVDNSRSNDISFNDKPKSAEIRELLRHLDLTADRDKFRTYTFSVDKPALVKVENSDSLVFGGYETNPAAALEDLKGRFPEDIYNSITIVSDGVFTSGANPLYIAKTFQCPVITIGIGDTVQRKDIVIKNVSYNEKAFTESMNKVRVELNAYGFMNETLNLSLFKEGMVIAVKSVQVNNNDWNGELIFEVRESEPGTIRYRVAAENKPGEITYWNNHSDFLINYIQNKINILYISGGPSYDNAVMSPILRRIRNYNVTIRTAKSPNDFYEGTLDYKTFGDLSAVVLHSFPISQTNPELLSALADKVKSMNIPLIFFADKNTDYKRLEVFDESIPFTVGKPGAGEGTVNMQSTNAAGNEYGEALKNVNALPPLSRNFGSVTQKAGSEVLLIDRISGEPIMIMRNSLKRKSAAFLAYGFWKWRLNPSHDYESSVENMLIEIINMSLIKDKKSKLTIIPRKDIFDFSENTRFTAEVYDDNFNPLVNAIITAKIYSGRNLIKHDLKFESTDNIYHLNAGNLPPGDYRIESEADVNGKFYAKDEVRFLVDTLNLEYKITRSNFENLRLLSDNTNGKFFAGYENIDSMNNRLKLLTDNKPPGSAASRYIHLNLWQNKYFLLAAIFLFAVEWIIRKRHNIP